MVASENGSIKICEFEFSKDLRNTQKEEISVLIPVWQSIYFAIIKKV